MEKPLIASLWTAVVLYAAIGLLGIILFHDATPNILDLTAGYGTGYSRIANTSEAIR
jgi:hypothetical protein